LIIAGQGESRHAHRVGAATFPLYLSADWSSPLPDITRAVLVLHGVLRNADDYFRAALSAQEAAARPARVR